MGSKSAPTIDTGAGSPFNLEAEAAAPLAQTDIQLANTQAQQIINNDTNSQLNQKLLAQAMGGGNSAGEAGIVKASSRGLAQQLAAASALRGVNPAAVQRQLMEQRSAATRNVAQNAETQHAADVLNAQPLVATNFNNQSAAQQNAIANAIQQGYGIATAGKAAAQNAAVGNAQNEQAAANNSAAQTGNILGAGLGAAGTIVGSIYGGPAGGAAGGAVGSAAGQGIGNAVGSDKRIKKDVKPAGKKVDKFLEAIAKRKK